MPDCRMRDSNPACRDADAQGTEARLERVGVRYGVDTGRAQPEPKHRFGRWRRPATCCGAGCRKICTLEFHKNASAWRAGYPYRIPALGAGSKDLFRVLIQLNKTNKNNELKICSMRERESLRHSSVSDRTRVPSMPCCASRLTMPFSPMKWAAPTSTK